jgi:hypothetical protein
VGARQQLTRIVLEAVISPRIVLEAVLAKVVLPGGISRGRRRPSHGRPRLGKWPLEDEMGAAK